MRVCGQPSKTFQVLSYLIRTNQILLSILLRQNTQEVVGTEACFGCPQSIWQQWPAEAGDEASQTIASLCCTKHWVLKYFSYKMCWGWNLYVHWCCTNMNHFQEKKDNTASGWNRRISQEFRDSFLRPLPDSPWGRCLTSLLLSLCTHMLCIKEWQKGEYR